MGPLTYKLWAENINGSTNFYELWAANINGSTNFYELLPPNINGSAKFHELWASQTSRIYGLQIQMGS